MESTEQVFLQKLVEKKVQVSVFLTCNVKLQGTLKSFDDSSILLEYGGRLQLIYKNAISTISSGDALKENELGQ